MNFSPALLRAADQLAPPPPYKAGAAHVLRGQLAELSLGPRRWPTHLPAYGANAHVRGSVSVCPEAGGGHVVVTLLGRMTSLSRARSLEVELVRIIQVFPVPKCGEIIDFSFRLPSQPSFSLPPSTARLTDGLGIHIRYSIRATVHPPLLAFRRKERVECEILYLPKSVIPVPLNPPPPLESPDRSSWHRTPLAEPAGAVLLLPDTTVAACDALPFAVELPCGVDSSAVPRVELVRHVCARVDDWAPRAVTLASAGADDRRLPACPGEVTWSVPGSVYVKYLVRVGETCVPLTLRTHSWDSESAGVKGPAFELAPRP